MVASFFNHQLFCFSTESVTGPEFVSVSISDKPVSEGQADIQKPVEGAIEQSGCLTQVIEQRNQHDSPPDVAASSLGCLTQVADNYTQVRYLSICQGGGIDVHYTYNCSVFCAGGPVMLVNIGLKVVLHAINTDEYCFTMRSQTIRFILYSSGSLI